MIVLIMWIIGLADMHQWDTNDSYESATFFNKGWHTCSVITAGRIVCNVN